MKLNQIILAGIVLLLTSCGKEESKVLNQTGSDQEVVAAPVVVNPNTFKMEVTALIKNDDELIVFWKDQSIAYFDDKNTIYNGVKGSTEPQTLVFEFPEGSIPNDIRFDISSKEDQQPVEIVSIKISQQGREFVIQKTDIDKFFTPNEFIEGSNGVYSFHKKGDSYDPILNTKQAFNVQMERILNTVF